MSDQIMVLLNQRKGIASRLDMANRAITELNLEKYKKGGLAIGAYGGNYKIRMVGLGLNDALLGIAIEAMEEMSINLAKLDVKINAIEELLKEQ
jgi:hypothetical protein